VKRPIEIAQKAACHSKKEQLRDLRPGFFALPRKGSSIKNNRDKNLPTPITWFSRAALRVYMIPISPDSELLMILNSHFLKAVPPFKSQSQ
jgi:hypothetical protein